MHILAASHPLFKVRDRQPRSTACVTKARQPFLSRYDMIRLGRIKSPLPYSRMSQLDNSLNGNAPVEI